MVYIQEVHNDPHGSPGIEAVLDSYNTVQQQVWIRDESVYVKIINRGLDINCKVYVTDHLTYQHISEELAIEVPRESDKVVAIWGFEPLEAGPRTQCIVNVDATPEESGRDIDGRVEIYA